MCQKHYAENCQSKQVTSLTKLPIFWSSIFLLLLLPSCRTHQAFQFSAEGVHGASATYGVTASEKSIISYTSIPGKPDTVPSDYRLVSTREGLHVFSHSDMTDSPEMFSCERQPQMCDNIQRAVEWTKSNYAFGKSFTFEILIMPNGYGYNYASTYPITEIAAKLRFAFEIPLGTEPLVELEADIIRLLTHELTHALVALEPTISLDPVSSEALAILTDSCAISSFTTLPFEDIHRGLAFSEDVLTKILVSDFSEILENLEAGTFIKADALVTRLFHELKEIYSKDARQMALDKVCADALASPPDFTNISLEDVLPGS